jgi:hypothetical protein
MVKIYVNFAEKNGMIILINNLVYIIIMYNTYYKIDSSRIVSGADDRTVRIWEDIGDGSRHIQTNICPRVGPDVRKTIVSYI